VVLVKSRGDKDRSFALPVMPGPDYIIAENDALIIYGREEDIDRALAL
jgi:K+/H+ antiporter YhaU regulatory subunit KhtT